MPHSTDVLIARRNLSLAIVESLHGSGGELTLGTRVDNTKRAPSFIGMMQHIMAKSIGDSRELSSLVNPNDLLEFKPETSKLMITKSNTAEDNFANGLVKQKVGNKDIKKRSIKVAGLPSPKSKRSSDMLTPISTFDSVGSAAGSSVACRLSNT